MRISKDKEMVGTMTGINGIRNPDDWSNDGWSLG